MKQVLMLMGALGAVLCWDGAVAQASADQVAAARADCAANRERYEEAEMHYRPAPSPIPGTGIRAEMMGDDEVAHARKMWERSCAYAEALAGSRSVDRASTTETRGPAGFEFERAPPPPPMPRQEPAPRPTAPPAPNVGGTRPPPPK